MEIIDCIALVDDDATTNFLNKRMILKNELAKEVLIFNNGMEAFQYISEPQNVNIKPNLILLDINMPVMNGFQFLDVYNDLDSNMKAEQVVVMLSSSEQPNDRLEAEKRGVVKYIAKPLTVEVIKQMIADYHAGF